ncbi:tyrosine-protein phosphatase [Rhodococcus triatomae]|nr:protein tyrosine/serine phosphatase [Rhodococcus triatomae BKS 15-14]
MSSARDPIVIAGLPNLRDVGGWPTESGGLVRRGLLYRSVEVTHLDDSGTAAFEALGVTTVFDLRTEAERTAQPDRLPPGVTHVVADVLADAIDEFGAHALQAVVTDPMTLAPLLADGRARTALANSYRDIVGSPGARSAYRRFFTDLADTRFRPALVHCTTGKDRTGWAAAALLTLLGVGSADVMHDYLLTNDELLPALTPLLEKFSAAGGDPAQLTEVLGVRREYLEVGLDEMTRRYGDVEGYFRDGLGIGDDTVRALTDAFVEPAPSS